MLPILCTSFWRRRQAFIGVLCYLSCVQASGGGGRLLEEFCVTHRVQKVQQVENFLIFGSQLNVGPTKHSGTNIERIKMLSRAIFIEGHNKQF